MITQYYTSCIATAVIHVMHTSYIYFSYGDLTINSTTIIS